MVFHLFGKSTISQVLFFSNALIYSFIAFFYDSELRASSIVVRIPWLNNCVVKALYWCEIFCRDTNWEIGWIVQDLVSFLRVIGKSRSSFMVGFCIPCSLHVLESMIRSCKGIVRCVLLEYIDYKRCFIAMGILNNSLEEEKIIWGKGPLESFWFSVEKSKEGSSSRSHHLSSIPSFSHWR